MAAPGHRCTLTNTEACIGSSFLSIPSQISRAGSRESFATDLSLLSLSSFASEISSNNRVRALVEYDDFENEKTDLDLARLRENVLEKMLESQMVAYPKLAPPPGTSRSRKGSAASGCKEKNRQKTSHTAYQDAVLATDEDQGQSNEGLCLSEPEFLLACATSESILKGTLFKSFSTSDVSSLRVLQVQKCIRTCTSLLHLPCVYAQMLRCRKRHIEELNQLSAAELLAGTIEEPGLLGLGHSGVMPNTQIVSHLLRGSSTKSKDEKSVMEENLSPTSEGQNAGGSDDGVPLLTLKKSSGPFMKKLRFSREIGKRIREDLLKKLGKHKHRLLTKVDLDKEKGRPVTKYERNFMIFHWLQSLDEDSFDDP